MARLPRSCRESAAADRRPPSPSAGVRPDGTFASERIEVSIHTFEGYCRLYSIKPSCLVPNVVVMHFVLLELSDCTSVHHHHVRPHLSCWARSKLCKASYHSRLSPKMPPPRPPLLSVHARATPVAGGGDIRPLHPPTAATAVSDRPVTVTVTVTWGSFRGGLSLSTAAGGGELTDPRWGTRRTSGTTCSGAGPLCTARKGPS